MRNINFKRDKHCLNRLNQWSQADCHMLIVYIILKNKFTSQIIQSNLCSILRFIGQITLFYTPFRKLHYTSTFNAAQMVFIFLKWFLL